MYIKTIEKTTIFIILVHIWLNMIAMNDEIIVLFRTFRQHTYTGYNRVRDIT